MVDSAAEKEGTTPSAAAPESSAGSASSPPDASSSTSPSPVDPRADTLTDETEAAEPGPQASSPDADRDAADVEEASSPSDSDAEGAADSTEAGEARADDAPDASDGSTSPPDEGVSESAEPPGEIAPAESDVPPPPKPSSRRVAAKTLSLDNPPDPLSEVATEKRQAARRSGSDKDVDSGWGSAPPPGLPPRPRGPRPRPPSSISTPSSTSPASLGLGARPSKRPHVEPSDDEAGAGADPPTKEANRVAPLEPDATNTNVVARDSADATAALSAQEPEPVPSPSSAPPAPANLPTAPTLHEEDEDDPTIVNYPQGTGDDEKTAVHPSRGPFVPPIADPAAAAADLELSPPTAELPPEFASLGEAFSSREAAMQAALAAATERPSLEGRSPAKEQQIVVAIATLLGVGMVLGAVGAYLTARAVAAGDASAGASLAGANVVSCISLFAAGFASLQPKQQARIGLIIASGAMLVIGFIWMLAAAFG